MALIPTTQVNVSPDDYKRRVAFALMQQGMDTSPVQAWTQGAARALQGALGGYEMYQDDQKQKADDADTSKAYLNFLNPGAGGSTADAATPGATPQTSTTGAPSPVATALADPYKIYSNDQPSPMDPPSGMDRVNMIKTILGEENTPAGQAGVANVIRNRAVDGSYGGDTPSAVVQAPNQFEPWNTQAGRSRMVAALQDPKQVAQADAAIKGAYGEGGQAPNDPTEGKTMFFSPGAQAALGRTPPTWAQGPGQMLGKTAFYDDNSDLPPNSQPTQGTSPYQVAGPPTAAPTPSPVAQALAPQAAPQAAPDDPAKAQIAAMLQSQNPQTRKMGQALASSYITAKMTADNTPINVGGKLVTKTGKVIYDGTEDKTPTSVLEYKYYKDNLPDGQQAMDYGTWATAKARAAATNVTTNVDTNNSQTYDKQLAEGLGKSHAALANGVEDAQTRARDIAAMQGAIDAIQKNGGTTGGLAPQARLELQKSINAGASALGIEKPFNEGDLSDKEFLTKFNRSMAGAQAKNAVGSRVTNFEMSNYLKANPGLDMSVTGNQRLLGIQGQIEQRNIAVGNAIRDATAQSISQGKKIDPVTVQKIITDYDTAHHVQDPITGQDLTQSYALPEFQKQANNPALSADHAANVGKIRRYNPATGNLE